VIPPGLDPADIQAVFLDLDGTILDHGVPSPAVAPAIARLEATGVHCIIATGRMLTSARRIAGEIGITAPLVCYQGAMVGSADGEILRHQPLLEDTARDLLRAIAASGHDGVAFIDETVYVARESDTAQAYSQNAGVGYRVVGDLADWLPAPVTKLVTMGTPPAMDALRDALLPRFGDRAFIAKSLPNYLEMAAPGVSKAHGCELVCELLGIAADGSVAFGDGENDLELLGWAGYGVGVGGGFPPLLELADWICPPLAADGVPRTLEAIAAARGG
jgi:Cof subfamily protein (haloacid dehalogenase superfamily)